MMERLRADLILVGGGLANTLIALRLSAAVPEIKILLVEQGDTLGGNHTWSFHGSDLSKSQFTWIEPLIQYNWSGYEVHFPNRTRKLNGSYHSITSESLHEVASRRLTGNIRLNSEVVDITSTHVTLANGSRLEGRAVIDGRGPRESNNLDVRYQKFVGRVVKLAAPHNLNCPIIMDATHEQEDGYRFFYTLPLDPLTLLIEDTRYSDTPDISKEGYSDAITAYAGSKGWRITETLRKEHGVLPITLGGDIEAWWDETTTIPRSGLNAALFHPATGYSLPDAARLADELTSKLSQTPDWTADDIYNITRNTSRKLWRNTAFYRALNRMLFLAAEPEQRRHVLERFYGLNPGLIARFYAGRNNGLDKLRILIGKPPVKISRAYDAVFRYKKS